MIGILLYIGGLLLAGFVGWGIGELLSLPGRAARERRDSELRKKDMMQVMGQVPAIIKEAVREALRDAKITPEAKNAITEVALASATAAIMDITGTVSENQPRQTSQATGRVDPPMTGGALWRVKGPGQEGPR